MATSGTVGQTTFEVAQLIEHAARRCGKIASSLGQEQLQIASDNLKLILTSMINKGMNMWCIERALIPLSTSQIVYTMPVGTIDVLETLHRTSTEVIPTWTTTTTAITGQFTQNTDVVSVALIFPTTQTLSLAFETSSDGIAWTSSLNAASTTYLASQRYVVDLDLQTPSIYFRVRETVAASVTFTSVSTYSQNIEVIVARINRDDYSALPDKRASGTPTQFWLDRKIPPEINLWPQPAQNTVLVVWYQREVQDVGTLSQNLEIPIRWAESIVWQLALRLCFELPGIDPDRISLVKSMADETSNDAGAEEFDNSPFYLAPSIRAYNA